MNKPKTNPTRGSHLPVLMAMMAQTTGPVLELGCGMYSTPYLHWACFPKQRPLVTMESDPEWWDFLRQFESAWHHVELVSDWDAVDLSRVWSVAFVDHSPSAHRWKEVVKLAHAEYVVAHDAENAQNHKYGYPMAHKHFRYRTKYSQAPGPYTAIFSNVNDVRGMVI